MTRPPVDSSSDTIDLADLSASLRRRWRQVAAWTALGLLAAAAVLALAPKRFEGIATVLLKSAPDPASSLLSRFGGAAAELAPAALGGAVKSPFETELQLLSSRAVVGEVVDSLGLQVRVLSPRGLPAHHVVAATRLPGTFRKRTVSVVPRGDGRVDVRSGDVTRTARPGETVELPVGRLTLAAALPGQGVKLQLLDREDAVTRVGKRLSVEKAGGEVARVAFAGDDSLSAAAVPNAVVGAYLRGRRTTDRGVNEHRSEFLAAQVDSVGSQLLAAERRLRAAQEASGIVDPQLAGKVGVEGGMALRQQLSGVLVEERAVEDMLARLAAGSLTPRQLVAYPAFLRSQGINDLLAQSSGLEIERTRLLERRTEADPEVVAITQSIAGIERQLVPLTRTYHGALTRQRVELERQIDAVTAQLAALPGEAETLVRLEREVRRLGQTSLALQTQLLDARLAAIGEGGEVRQVDVAAPPKRVAFPRPLVTLAGGGAGGLVLGLIAALLAASFGRRIDSPGEAARVADVPVALFDPRVPLLVAGLDGATDVVVVPLDPSADAPAVADRLSRTLAARAGRVHEPVEPVAAGNGKGWGTAHDDPAYDRLAPGPAIRVVASLESDETSGLLTPDRPVVLVGRLGRLERRRLAHAAGMLRALDVPCAGIVLQPRA